MPALTMRQRNLLDATVSIIGFGTASVLEYDGHDGWAQIPVTAVVVATFVLFRLAPKPRPKPGARRRRAIALAVAVLVVLALVFAAEHHRRFDDRDFALLWLSCAALAVWQLVSAALKPRAPAEETGPDLGNGG